MDFLKPENLLRYGYKDCLLCEVERKGEEKRCEPCSGRLDQRERLLWEIRRERFRQTAGRLSLVFPGLGHIYDERYLGGIFWASLLPLTLGLVLNVWKGITWGHAFLLAEAGLIWWLAWLDVRRGHPEPSAPCQDACPAGLRVPDYIALVRENRPLEALALVYDKLPFAAFCGRACPHPCEQECVRNEFGAPISIMAIKRHAADRGCEARILPQREDGEAEKALRVAVVGAGPAGLSAADHLARLGCRVTMFDSREEPGGMMRYGAPEFRFPTEALRYDLERIFARGIEFRAGVKVGRDVQFSALEAEGFDAVMIAAGTPAARAIPGSGTEAQGFVDACSFLEGVRRNRPLRPSGRVVVVGGGDVAFDCARTALRLGASEATVACIESIEEMRAHPWVIADAVDEGVRILPSTAVKTFRMRGDRTAGFEALRAEGFDTGPGGAVVPRTRPGTEFEVPADTIVLAVGYAPELGFLPPGAFRKPLDARIHVFRLIFEGRESKVNYYIFGDCAAGPRTVVEAAASGRAAAMNIYSSLAVEDGNKARYKDNYRRRNEPHEPDRPEWRIRLGGTRLSAESRRGNFEEVDKGLTAECAHGEAERCARCNLSLEARRKGGDKG
ncbi:MAG: FAD-dependent oxidoreductase [Thermodesulfobacteriota bacterium]